MRKHDKFKEVIIKMKNEVFMLSGCEKVIKKLSIYREIRGINLEIVHGSFNSPNRLSTLNHILLR